jgi:hypothetical protein
VTRVTTQPTQPRLRAIVGVGMADAEADDPMYPIRLRNVRPKTPHPQNVLAVLTRDEYVKRLYNDSSNEGA